MKISSGSTASTVLTLILVMIGCTSPRVEHADDEPISVAADSPPVALASVNVARFRVGTES